MFWYIYIRLILIGIVEAYLYACELLLHAHTSFAMLLERQNNNWLRIINGIWNCDRSLRVF
jgi:hypothetical protein